MDCEEEVVVVRWQCPGVGWLGDPLEAYGLESLCDVDQTQRAFVDCPVAL